MVNIPSIYLGFRAAFIFMILISLYFSFLAGGKLLLYFFATKSTSAEEVHFDVVEGSWGRFYLEGTFRFHFKDNLYQGETVLSEPFINKPHAKKQASLEEKKEWNVYFDAKNPKRATLEKKIPMKEIISALLLWVSSGYLLLVQKRVNNTR